MTGRRRLQELRRAACLFPVWVEGYRPSAPPPSRESPGIGTQSVHNLARAARLMSATW